MMAHAFDPLGKLAGVYWCGACNDTARQAPPDTAEVCGSADTTADTSRSQVAGGGAAQEPERVFIARKRHTDPCKCPQFSFDKKDRRVTVYYFYLWDAGFGAAFIKVCTYCPWPVKAWVNGHEWAKQQARKIGFAFTELSNGFASAEDPAVLQKICDALQPGTINVFFQRWLSRLPLPLDPA